MNMIPNRQQIPLRAILFFNFVILVLTGMSTTTMATTDTLQDSHPFRLGFLRIGLESNLPQAALDDLVDFIQSNDQIRKEMSKLQIENIFPFELDSYQEMLDRLNHNEFDLAYCPAKIYVEQKGDYIPILQLCPKNAVIDFTKNPLFAWRGVIISSKTIAGISIRDPVIQFLKESIASNRMAFPSAHSAVGYVYPLLTLNRRFGISSPGGFLFLGSSQEVARAVINGIIPYGACEEGALIEVVKSIPSKGGKPYTPEDFVTILARTNPLPTDPIILKKKYDPAISSLGAVLKSSLIKFHNSHADFPKVGESSYESYEQLRKDLEKYKQILDKSPK